MARQIRRPELGRPADSRVTADVIAQDPRLAGVSPFDPAQDVDLIDEINNALVGVAEDLEAASEPPELALNDLTDVDTTGAQPGNALIFREDGSVGPGAIESGGGMGGYIYGWGRGGDVVVGTAMIPPFHVTGTNSWYLSNDVLVRNLTVPAGVTLETRGWRVFVSGTLTLEGTINNAGGDSSGGVSNPTSTNGAGSLGYGGGNADVTYALGGRGGRDGMNRDAFNATRPPNWSAGATPAEVGQHLIDVSTFDLGAVKKLNGGSAGLGRQSGTTLNGATSTNGVGGGGGGVVFVAARTITGSGTITARGGNASAGTVTGTMPSSLTAYGGGGGGGGYIRLITTTNAALTSQGAGLYKYGSVNLNVAGGLPGAGGNGGPAGTAGSPGTVEVMQLK